MEYQIATYEVSEFEGDIPREELHKVHWTPAEGALLVSGIRVAGEQVTIDPDFLSIAKVSKWRINHCIYAYKQWCCEHDPQLPIHPSEFLSWYKQNPVPNLDFRGQHFEENCPATQSAEAGKRPAIGSPIPSPKATRTTELQEYIEAAVKEEGSEEAAVVFNALQGWATKRKRGFSFEEESRFGYKNAKGVFIEITLRKVREALQRRKKKRQQRQSS